MPLFSALARFKNLTSLDCFRILFDRSHVNVINTLSHLTHAEFTECQWVYRHHIPYEERMHLQHLLVDHGPNKRRYNWLFNTHPNHLTSLTLTSGMPADFISGLLPPLPNLESLEINGIAMVHPEFPSFLSLCPGLIELRVTTDALLPSYVRAAEDVITMISPDFIPDLRVYEGPAGFLPALTRGRLVTHVGVYACPMFMNTFTMTVGSAFMKQQVRSLKIRVPKVTKRILALISYFKAMLAVEIVVTNEGRCMKSRQSYNDILTALDNSVFPPPRHLEYLSIAEESTTWGEPKESPWYDYQRRLRQHTSLSSSKEHSDSSSSLSSPSSRPIPESEFINKCTSLRYVMLSDSSRIIAAWNPQLKTDPQHVEIKTFRQWQRQRLGLLDPIPYGSL
ncbi:hypothetical protein P691DRAFT_763447 [Macrolepiota fuliginosa MF-IS2]|uniref:Uncharacterized protein n=1 Tax=Macrolepiota fuliginosa MF-IS2 TaxID=1400762 RepID=A0A9P5X5G1_9AGAR|nr:hypothetical protein P691DRAFT_763447 [Macrolepiota fuliginosa MF-IS2]